jgi:predicted membrane chloride channel (bestrophin family)
MQKFITHDYLMLENEVSTIPYHFENTEKKPLMKLADFHSLAIKMTNTSANIIKCHRISLTPFPVYALETVLCTLHIESHSLRKE